VPRHLRRPDRDTNETRGFIANGKEGGNHDQDERSSDAGNPRRATLSRPVAWGWPFRLAHKLTEEIDRMFENFGVRRGFFSTFPPALEEARWFPHVEVVEKNGQLIVRTDLPGLSKEEVTVEINNEMLIIHGERKREEEEKDERFYRSERSYGNFQCAIPLPEGVNPETAKATFKDGVLEVTLPAPSPSRLCCSLRNPGCTRLFGGSMRRDFERVCASRSWPLSSCRCSRFAREHAWNYRLMVPTELKLGIGCALGRSARDGSDDPGTRPVRVLQSDIFSQRWRTREDR
jgi:HSP20 family protein